MTMQKMTFAFKQTEICRRFNRLVPHGIRDRPRLTFTSSKGRTKAVTLRVGRPGFGQGPLIVEPYGWTIISYRLIIDQIERRISLRLVTPQYRYSEDADSCVLTVPERGITETHITALSKTNPPLSQLVEFTRAGPLPFVTVDPNVLSIRRAMMWQAGPHALRYPPVEALRLVLDQEWTRG